MWQPIETAPIGIEFLVYQPEWKSGRNILPPRITVVSQAGNSRDTTHWQPLPTPPEK